MLETIIVILIILWLLGAIGPVSLRGAGNFIHILLVIALILIVFRLLS
jgi:Family of unknown function (DUF5670)